MATNNDNWIICTKGSGQQAGQPRPDKYSAGVGGGGEVVGSGPGNMINGNI